MCVQAFGGREGFSTDYFEEDGDVEHPAEKNKNTKKLKKIVNPNKKKLNKYRGRGKVNAR